MALTSSTMLDLGSSAPDFELSNAVDGAPVSLGDFAEAPALLVMFICNHCPFVQHVRDEIGRLGRDYLPRGVAIVAINSNSIESHPQDGPDHMKELARAEGWEFPFLFDATQAVAKRYRAACTPEFYLFDADRRLVYRGQLDDSRPQNSTPVTGSDVRRALESVLSGDLVPDEQKPSIGCNIKWKPGNEPDYYGPV